MAKRPVFVPNLKKPPFFDSKSIEFKWHSGFAPSQKKRNVKALHEAAKKKHGNLLEVSTKSDSPLGNQLSAFNLHLPLKNGREIPLESAFQGSKIFKDGGPYKDIYSMPPNEAKNDNRVVLEKDEKGRVIRRKTPIGYKFDSHEFEWPLTDAFYHWLYLKALACDENYADELPKYDGFTDIEFNPEKSKNCQAKSCALFVSLVRKDLLVKAIQSPETFMETIEPESVSGHGNARVETYSDKQMLLIK